MLFTGIPSCMVILSILYFIHHCLAISSRDGKVSHHGLLSINMQSLYLCHMALPPGLVILNNRCIIQRGQHPPEYPYSGYVLCDIPFINCIKFNIMNGF